MILDRTQAQVPLPNRQKSISSPGPRDPETTLDLPVVGSRTNKDSVCLHAERGILAAEMRLWERISPDPFGLPGLNDRKYLCGSAVATSICILTTRNLELRSVVTRAVTHIRMYVCMPRLAGSARVSSGHMHVVGYSIDIDPRRYRSMHHARRSGIKLPCDTITRARITVPRPSRATWTMACSRRMAVSSEF